MEFENICDIRRLTDKEVGAMVAMQRGGHGWTQETLAEIAKVTVRTVQRVEKGDPSSPETRRALARAFEFSDIDFFNKSLPLPNPEKMKQEKERLDRETVEVTIKPLSTGLEIRELAEICDAAAFDRCGTVDEEAEEYFAVLQDNFRDYGDVKDCCSATQKLDVNKSFLEVIEDLQKAGFVLGSGTRRLRFVSQQWASQEPVRFTAAYIVIAPIDGLPSSIRVPRSARMGF
ncbi:Transcriptional regulator, contains XRE-family HTH domain [Bradyrhizobium sp. Ghvi]|uniref:helix-turn-helix domain-containing protein n=1 Tax=Bradyrhizobium sp. Ghvi TaxID=1855319 RepID=UPI0008EF3E0F|nr:helix-turn-helix domain-containing protein [Bradyrhizobium sp. Ghvi]SFN64740.1 Transcriptional regulator, contains XRE-family HTH domain [Bradyrhizobium sp. Ghvi]